ncbi:MAG: hypothetical protein ACFFDI_09650 [Promethearchaeota archaeon]
MLQSLVFYSLIILTFIRLIGLGISVNIYLTLRKKRSFYLISGWACWVLAGILPIFAYNTSNQFFHELLLTFNATFMLEGFVLIILGILSYYRTVPTKISFIIIIGLFILPPSLAILGLYEVSINLIAVPLLYIAFFVTVIGAWIEKPKMKKTFGREIKWYYITAIYGGLVIIGLIYLSVTSNSNVSYGLYESTNELAIMINYLLGIGVTILAAINMFALEYGIITNQKFALKDNYSHDLGNMIQVVMGCVYVIRHFQTISNESEVINMLDKIEDISLKAGKLIGEVRKL